MTHQKDFRIEHELAHGKFLLEHGAGEIWGWETPAGKVRWARRVDTLSSFIKKGMKILELGCGTGYFTKELAKTNVEIIAIDVSPDLLDIARKTITCDNVAFIQDNACAMSFNDETFDLVLGSSVLHHLDIESANKEIFRVLKPGGMICFTEPNMLNPQIFFQKNIPWLKKYMGDSPDETAFIRFSMKAKLVNAGFKEIRIKPFDFLHPSIPKKIIPFASSAASLFEHIPLLKEIAGSLLIIAEKEF